MPHKIRQLDVKAGVEIPVSPASLLRLKAGEPAEAKLASVDPHEALTRLEALVGGGGGGKTPRCVLTVAQLKEVCEGLSTKIIVLAVLPSHASPHFSFIVYLSKGDSPKDSSGREKRNGVLFSIAPYLSGLAVDFRGMYEDPHVEALRDELEHRLNTPSSEWEGEEIGVQFIFDHSPHQFLVVEGQFRTYALVNPRQHYHHPYHRYWRDEVTNSLAVGLDSLDLVSTTIPEEWRTNLALHEMMEEDYSHYSHLLSHAYACWVELHYAKKFYSRENFSRYIAHAAGNPTYFRGSPDFYERRVAGHDDWEAIGNEYLQYLDRLFAERNLPTVHVPFLKGEPEMPAYLVEEARAMFEQSEVPASEWEGLPEAVFGHISAEMVHPRDVHVAVVGYGRTVGLIGALLAMGVWVTAIESFWQDMDFDDPAERVGVFPFFPQELRTKFAEFGDRFQAEEVEAMMEAVEEKRHPGFDVVFAITPETSTIDSALDLAGDHSRVVFQTFPFGGYEVDLRKIDHEAAGPAFHQVARRNLSHPLFESHYGKKEKGAVVSVLEKRHQGKGGAHIHHEHSQPRTKNPDSATSLALETGDVGLSEMATDFVADVL